MGEVERNKQLENLNSNIGLVSDNDTVLTFDIKGKRVRISNISIQLDDSNFIKAKIRIDDETEKYVCFKIPENMDVKSVIEARIFQKLLIANKMFNLQENKYNYIGNITKDKEGIYILNEKKSRQSIKYVREILDSKLEREREQKEDEIVKQILTSKKTETKEIPKETFKNEMNKQVSNHLYQTEILRQKRKNNPQLEFIDVKIKDVDVLDEDSNIVKEKRTYMDFDAVDINTGEIIILNDLYLLSKEKNEIIDDNGVVQKENYMYTANYRKTDNEIDVTNEQRRNEDGSVVVFELPFPIHNILAKNNKEQQQLVLELLSEDEQFKYKKGKISYLGCIEDGQIDRTHISSKKMQHELEEYLVKYVKIQEKTKGKLQEETKDKLQEK